MDEENKKHTKTKIIVCITIIIIIILLLLTSCNSKIMGKIGNLFQFSSNHIINKDDKNNIKEERETLLKFDTSTSDITTDDDGYKIGFNSSLIDTEYGCKTSDANVAICAVFDNYVEVYPKSTGSVDITVSAIKDNIKYISTNKLNIVEGNKKITISKKKVTSYLNKNKTIKISYDTNGINGDVEVIVEDEDILSAKAKNGILSITPKKSGSTTVSLKIKNHSKEYITSVNINVLKQKKSNKTTTKKNTTSKKKTTTKTTKIKDNTSKSSSKVKDSTTTKITSKSTTNTTTKSTTKVEDTTSNTTTSTSSTTTSTTSTTTTTEVVHSYSLSIDNKRDSYILNNSYIDIEYSIKDNGIDVTNIENIDSITISDNIPFNIDTLGIIRIIPNSINNLNKDITLNIKYKDKEVSHTFKIVHNYDVTSDVSLYDIKKYTGEVKDIPITTNMLSDDIKILGNDSNNITIIDNKNKTKIEISLNNNIATLEFINDLLSDSKIIKVKPISGGTATISIKYYIYDSLINTKTIDIDIKDNYSIIFDANGGFFSIDGDNNKITTKGPFIVESISLVNYNEAYKVVDEDNCEYYKLKEYNTKADGSGNTYSLDSIIDLTENITLYAIYDNNIIKPDITTGVLNIDITNLFKENNNNLIYPGKSKVISDVLNITNNTGKKIKLKNIILEEQNYCISEGCINIGYIVKSNIGNDSSSTYYYGDNNKYTILNKDINTTKVYEEPFDSYYQNKRVIPLNDGIVLDNNATVDLGLLWKWVEENDRLDTKIGSIKEDIYYSLNVSFEYATVKDTCNIGD